MGESRRAGSLAKGPLDAPIMRQVQISPVRVIEARLLCACRIPLEKLPGEIEAFTPTDANGAAVHLRVGRARGLERRDDAGRSDCLAEETAATYRVARGSCVFHDASIRARGEH